MRLPINDAEFLIRLMMEGNGVRSCQRRIPRRKPSYVSRVSDMLRGYKVYRNQQPGEDGPWLYETQGVYDKQGRLQEVFDKHGNLLKKAPKVNKTCDLVPDGMTGSLQVAFRALTVRELALLLQACSVPWRIGGGKPLGLGLCRVRIKRLIDEVGQQPTIRGWNFDDSNGELKIDGWEKEEAIQAIQGRVEMWKASQTPVALLRYPRAVDSNRFGKSRGGHAWFQRHAQPRMVSPGEDGTREPGLTPLYIDGELKERAEQAGEALDPSTPMISGQVLLPFVSARPQADVLYGYDAINTKTEEQRRPFRRVYLQLERFDTSSPEHVTGKEKSEGSHGKDAEFREKQKEDRTRHD